MSTHDWHITHVSELPFEEIWVNGLRAYVGTLLESGWGCVVKHNYYTKMRKVYLRCPITRLIIMARFTDQDWHYGWREKNEAVGCDYITQESNQRITPPKVLDERELCEDDIPTLLEIVNKLQKKYYLKKKTKKPTAEIIDIEKYLKKYQEDRILTVGQ